MSKLEPGDTFTIGYGNGRTLEVVALSWKQQREFGRAEEGGYDSIDAAYEALEAKLRKCVPSMSDEQFESLLETLNFALIQEIIRNTNQQNQLTEDEEKKSE